MLPSKSTAEIYFKQKLMAEIDQPWQNILDQKFISKVPLIFESISRDCRTGQLN